MNLENLLSGLIGAVIGAFVVVIADTLRWRRGTRAAARLVYTELLSNGQAAENFRPEGFLTRFLSDQAWEAEQARLASILRPSDLISVAYAYRQINFLKQAVERFGTAEAVRVFMSTKPGVDIRAALVSAVATARSKLAPYAWSRRQLHQVLTGLEKQAEDEATLKAPARAETPGD